MKFDYLINRSLVLVIWGQVSGGRHGVKLFPGLVVKDGDDYFLQRGEGKKSPEIPDDWLDLVVEIPADLKAVMAHCDYQLSLTTEDVLARAEDLEAFGLD